MNSVSNFNTISSSITTSGNKPMLYGIDSSPSVKAVRLTLKELNVEYEFRIVNPRSGDNLTKDYLNKNPAHTLPTLEHNGQYIGDSHAIMAYLVGIYGKPDDPLYPKDLYKRAVVDHRLHYENGALFTACVHQIFAPLFKGLRNDVPEEKLKAIAEAYDNVERFFGEHKFIAGPNMTIADFSCITSISNMYFIKPFDAELHPKLNAWAERMRTLPYFSEVMENEKSMKVMQRLSATFAKL